MTFEEFFKKKKISLQTFEQGEPALFSEFNTHYEQMGEKSFDHTKKYWFNKLRLRFPAPVEIKAEKVAIENPLAEQTITESLIESSSPPPNIGFKPKFRAGVTKPAAPESAGEVKNTEPVTTSEHPAESQEQVQPLPSLGFKPKFRAGVTKSAAVVPEQKEEPKAEQTSPEEPPEDNKEAKPAYKPRFNMKNIKPKPPEE
jgi:hypothetical protein